MKTKIIKIDKIKVDKTVYPRVDSDWVTKAKYHNALLSGAKFPPITIAKFGSKNILVDGLHRLLAYQSTKQTHVECEVLEGLTMNKIYEEAVKRNLTHGRPFSTHEVVMIAVRLQDLGYSPAKVSELVNIPVDKITNFILKRTTLPNEDNERFALKSQLKNLAGTSQDGEPDQNIFTGRTQVNLLDSLISLIENNWLDLNSEMIMEKLIKLAGLINSLNLKTILPEEE